jgi:putative redox protein
MELALTSLAACASMDVGPILAKQRQTVTDMRVTATGQREEGTPSPFTEINLHFDLWGAIEEAAAHRALDLAVYKYCSVGAMLSCSVEITWTLTIHEDPR